MLVQYDLTKPKEFKTVILIKVKKLKVLVWKSYLKVAVWVRLTRLEMKNYRTDGTVGMLELILVFVYAIVVLAVLTRSFRILNEYLSETCTLCASF